MNVEKIGEYARITKNNTVNFKLRNDITFNSLVGKAFVIYCNDSTPFTFDGITHLGIIRPKSLQFQKTESKPGVAICIGQGNYY